jgi:hypothetical protein
VNKTGTNSPLAMERKVSPALNFDAVALQIYGKERIRITTDKEHQYR